MYSFKHGVEISCNFKFSNLENIYPEEEGDLKCQEGMLARDSLTCNFMSTFLSQILSKHVVSYSSHKGTILSHRMQPWY